MQPAGSCDPQNPWPGLLQYEEADREFFRGRQVETDELLRLVMRARFAVLFCRLSGLGKSSLLQAGLFPRLRSEENILPVYVRLDFTGERPDFSAQALRALLNEAAASGIEAPSPVAVNEGCAPPATNSGTLWEYFHRSGADFWDKKNRTVTPLLVFDQFEEVFTHGRANSVVSQAIESFFDELSDLAEGRAPRGRLKHGWSSIRRKARNTIFPGMRTKSSSLFERISCPNWKDCASASPAWHSTACASRRCLGRPRSRSCGSRLSW